MILYHGSNIEIKNPVIIESENGRDFGPAFYLTPIKEHAEKWAKKKVIFNHGGVARVSIFEFDENKTDLITKVFPKADIEWLEFIILHRRDPKAKHGFDIVEGKIADDSVGETVNYVVSGVMRKEDAVERLKFQEINYQLAFCTEKSLTHLLFKGSYEVK